jgi:hypothetical protein
MPQLQKNISNIGTLVNPAKIGVHEQINGPRKKDSGLSAKAALN